MTQKAHHRTKDIIQVTSDGSEFTTKTAQKNVQNYLEKLISTISQDSSDMQELKLFEQDLMDVLKSFETSKDVAQFRNAFNNLHEIHTRVIVKYHIAMNLQIKLSLGDMIIKEKTKRVFIDAYNESYSSCVSKVSEFLSKKVYDENTTVSEHHKWLIEFYYWLTQ